MPLWPFTLVSRVKVFQIETGILEANKEKSKWWVRYASLKNVRIWGQMYQPVVGSLRQQDSLANDGHFLTFLFAHWTAYKTNNTKFSLIFQMTAQTHVPLILLIPITFSPLFEDFISSVGLRFGLKTLLGEISWEEWLVIQLSRCLNSPYRDSSHCVIRIQRLRLW